MTVLNTWDRAGEDGLPHAYAAVQCDGCFPCRLAFGDAVALRGFGWRFDRLEEGPHRCPVCPSSGSRRPDASMRFADAALPNLLVVGAAKCGTTSLHRYLAAHPEIQMSPAKELRFFQDPDCLGKLDGYAGFFDASSPVRGEATPAYSAYPLLPGVPERMRDAVPDARLIYLVREPVERAVAAYAEARSNDKEPRSVDEALGRGDDPYNPYIAQSRYAMQVERYLRVFPREQLLVLDHDDLLRRRAETLRRVFRFLGVDESFTSERFEQLTNTRKSKRRRNRAGRMLYRSRLLPVVQRIPERPRAALLKPVRGLISDPVEVTLDSRTRGRLEAALAGEMERLTALVGPLSVEGQVASP